MSLFKDLINLRGSNGCSCFRFYNIILLSLSLPLCHIRPPTAHQSFTDFTFCMKDTFLYGRRQALIYSVKVKIWHLWHSDRRTYLKGKRMMSWENKKRALQRLRKCNQANVFLINISRQTDSRGLYECIPAGQRTELCRDWSIWVWQQVIKAEGLDQGERGREKFSAHSLHFMFRMLHQAWHHARC